MANGWKKISSKVVHKNPWYHVSEDEVILPNGQPGKYFVLHTNGSAMVLPVRPDGKICLVQQSRYTGGNTPSIEFVGGGMQEGTAPLQNAKRELREETGLTANNWIDLGIAFPFLGIAAEKMHYFLAKDLSKNPNQLDDSEDITVAWKSIDEIKKMIAEGQIIDGETITGILKYILYKENQ
ncbi:MAG TPA: NUDIX hydrolase [bacterium]|nr:NUDIX hydrolase [bacterium]